MSVEALTYAPPGARLTVSPEAARSLARRGRKPRSLSADGKALGSLGLAEIRQMPPRDGQAGDIASLAAKIEALKAEIARLDARVELLQNTETMAAKDMTARREADVAVLQTGGRSANSIDNHGQAARRLGRLAATIVEADRNACR